MADPTIAQVKALTEKHLRRYRNFLVAAAQPKPSLLGRSVNVEETTYYLKIWEAIEAKGYDYAKLDRPERREVTDALMDEDLAG